MKAGKVTIDNDVIRDLLSLPIDWTIEKITPVLTSPRNQSEMIISGSAFPETDGKEVERVNLRFHKENIRVEVEEVG